MTIKEIVVSLAQLPGIKLASTTLSTQLPWFGRALLAPPVKHLKRDGWLKFRQLAPNTFLPSATKGCALA